MHQPVNDIRGPQLSRRGFLRAGLLTGLAALGFRPQSAFAWSSWTNASSEALKGLGMGDCVHEDLVQIAYARLVRRHQNETTKNTLLNPWAGQIETDNRYATIAGDTVDKGTGKVFADADDLAVHLFRENLAYLRIGSFWNDAAANTLMDFSYSCYYATSIPKFSGSDHYEGAWDVGQHLIETHEKNKESYFECDALVQFTMNDRNNFIHGMLCSTASHSEHLKQEEVKKFALQWLGVAYEYARTGEVRTTSDVPQQGQAEKIFMGFIDTYGQLDDSVHNLRVSLKVSAQEASVKHSHRRMRLRALGMVCHTLEDFWCPSHTCRAYSGLGSIPKNSILAFSNYKLQNGSQPPMFGYHIPFDRYATSDAKNSTNWREALTRGDSTYKGTGTLSDVLDGSMECLDNAHTYFNTLGMNESIDTITKLFEFIYADTPWDEGVRAWVDTEITPTFFNEDGQSYVCDAGRRSLYTPTYIISPIKALKQAYKKLGLRDRYDEILATANAYNAWQRGAHKFFSGEFNKNQSKTIPSGFEGDAIWSDAEGENRLVMLADKLHGSFSDLGEEQKGQLRSRIGFNGCHNMVCAIERVRGMLQEFNIELRGSIRPDDDDALKKLAQARAFFEAGLQDGDGGANVEAQDLAAQADDENYVTARMTLDEVYAFDNGTYSIVVRDMDSLATGVMFVPENTPGKERLEKGSTNLIISYILDTEFEDDPDYSYIVREISAADSEQEVFFLTGTVTSVAEDKKSMEIDANGMSVVKLFIGDETADIPAVGAYICASYASNNAGGFELVEYEELNNPGDLTKVTYPVAEVYGSSIWLLTNDGEDSDGYRDYLEIEYGTADVYTVPQVGQEVTVYYPDEVYGATTDVDQHALASMGATDAWLESEATDEDDQLTDAPTAGYIELGDEYDDLNYGNEVFHVANIIGDLEQPEPEPTPEPAPSSDPTPTPDQPTPEPSPAPASGSTPNKPTANNGPLPKTDDPFASAAGLLSAAAVTGAALVGYSALNRSGEQENSEE